MDAALWPPDRWNDATGRIIAELRAEEDHARTQAHLLRQAAMLGQASPRWAFRPTFRRQLPMTVLHLARKD